MHHFRTGFMMAVFLLGTALALPGSAWGDTFYTAVLDGPTAGNSSPATGTALLTLNASETEVSYVIEFSGLTGTETVAHIHNAPPGILGPIFHDLLPGSPKIGIWEVGAFEVAELNAGRVNILIHSDLFGAGEIRGNVAYSSTSSAETRGGGDIPAQLVMGSNYPNPFNPLTTIRYGIPVAGPVRLTIHDVRGRLVNSLVDEVQSAGYHEIAWDGTDHAGTPVGSGVYLAVVSAANLTGSRKLSLLK